MTRAAGQVAIDFSFDVYSRMPDLAAPELSGAPPWFTIQEHRRAGDLEAIYGSENARALMRANPKVAAAWQTMLRVRMAPGTRPRQDAHLQNGIQTAAALAVSSSGFVADPLARRMLDGRAFGETCEPGVENHVTYEVARDDAAPGGGGLRARSWGMGKFGFLDLVFAVPGGGTRHEPATRALVDMVCSGLVAGKYEPGVVFEAAAGRMWRADPQADSIRLNFLSPESMIDLLAQISAGMQKE